REVVERDRAVGADPRDPGGRDDARGAGHGLAPDELSRGPLEAERLGGRADDQVIAAEERRAEVDPGDERAPALGVAEAGRARERQALLLRLRAGRGEDAVRLGRRVDPGVLTTDVAEGVARRAEVAAECAEPEVRPLRAIPTDERAD